MKVEVNDKQLQDLKESLDQWAGYAGEWTPEEIVLEGLRWLEEQVKPSKVYKFVSWRAKWKVM